MDYMNNFGPCNKCGKGGISFPEIKYIPTVDTFETKNNYCSKCGEKLTITCSACNGSGKNSNYDFLNRDRYCSECGRKLNTNDKCANCNGTGKIYDSMHQLFCTGRF